ncbi:MAG: S8 family serine peptidase [Candidatus Thalassarchaeaceae archaeon]|nr:S8 family serine peptidase [Candidatus Thalassarchaeaceae archaeon]
MNFTGRAGTRNIGLMWISLAVLAMFVLPMMGAAAPITNSTPVEDEHWWQTTNMDKNGDKIHDAIPIAINSTQYDWVDDEGRISVIVDFDHLPTEADERLLEKRVDFRVQFRYHIIDSIAGSVEVSQIGNLANLPGVVLVEIDGILSTQMADVNEIHGITNVWEETGYTGAGSVVAIIDTGIDGSHEGLNDLDDNNETNDPKVIGFYDVINRPADTNGTDVEPYDDQGHGTHCAGITAGTGAPTYEYVGVAPQAQLVGVKVLSESGSGSFAQVMQGMQWTIDNRHKFNIRAASMSLGGPGASEWTASEQESTNRMANEMVRNGIALFIAAGNSAFSAQIGTPGSAEDVITVGALDKDTGIAIYSSQGPTEEGRIKPNIAFVGSNVMAPDFNTGTGYTSKSGTSMATPGAAGLAALMYQANPDLSPFDVRNIMQETAEYRLCSYMFKNEPCAEDLIPKNRQNNVYGHGHTNGEPSVAEAANQVYGLTLSINVSATTGASGDNKVHIGPGEGVSFEIVGESVGKVQWRTWDMRDYWSDHPDFEAAGTQFSITHEMIHDRLKFLPGNSVTGNQTIMVRAIAGDNASTNSVVHLHVMGDTPIESSTDTGGLNGTVFVLATLVFILAVGLIMTMLMLQGVISTPKLGPFGNDSDEYDDDSEESAVEVKASAGKEKS